MNDNPNDAFDELMRRSLAEEADRVEPTDALPEIRARAHAQRRPAARRPWVLTAGVAALGTAAAIGAFTVFTGQQDSANDGDTVAGAGTTTSATGVPSSKLPRTPVVTPGPTLATPTTQVATKAPTDAGVPEQSVKSAVVPIYWLGDRAGGTSGIGPKPSAQARSTTRLYRTWSKVSGRPAVQALRIMTTKSPSDPDYYTVWRGAEVGSVLQSKDMVTVDFKQLPSTRLDADLADVAAQQLVYTVQGALGSGSMPILITQQGRIGAKLFGQIDTSAPLGRAQAADVQALVSIDSPENGQVLGDGPVTVQGSANAFEATVNYQATNLKTRAVVKGFTNTKQGQKFAPYLFELKLDPGSWQIEAYLISDADGTISDADSKIIEVK
ncbi:Gmad2 immunoglobulin-like domain-containing protein [Kribbella sp. NPDC055071]